MRAAGVDALQRSGACIDRDADATQVLGATVARTPCRLASRGQSLECSNSSNSSNGSNAKARGHLHVLLTVGLVDTILRVESEEEW